MNNITEWCLKNKSVLILGIALAAFFDNIILSILITGIIAWQIKRYKKEQERKSHD